MTLVIINPSEAVFDIQRNGCQWQSIFSDPRSMRNRDIRMFGIVQEIPYFTRVFDKKKPPSQFVWVVMSYT